MRAPNICPICGESNLWKKVDESNFAVGNKFSVKKAIIGGVILGPVGVLGGLMGKKEKYHCGKCGYEQDYECDK